MEEGVGGSIHVSHRMNFADYDPLVEFVDYLTNM